MALHTEWKIGDREPLKLRLTSRGCVDAERRLGTNPLNILTSIDEGNLPRLEAIIVILHQALQPFEHGYSTEDVYELYDEYIDAGGTMVDLIPLILDVFKVSGFFKEEKPKKGAKKKSQ